MKLDRWTGLVAAVLGFIVLWRIRQILLLTFLAVVLATVLNHAVKHLQKLGIKRGFAVAILLAMILAMISIFIIAIAPPFAEQVRELINLIPQSVLKLQLETDWLQRILPPQLFNDLRNSLMGLPQIIQSLASNLFSNFFALFSNALTVILNTLLVLVLTIMILINPSQYRRAFLLLFPRSFRHRVQHVLFQCNESISGWFVCILFNMSVIAILSGLGLWILGVPLALAHALFAGLLAFIPNVGPVLSVIPPTAVALLETPWKAIAVIVMYIVIQQIESNFLTPWVMQKQVSLLPAVTLISQVIFAVIFGFLGLLLALPLILAVQALLQEFWIEDEMADVA